jgi:hypothetical protein
MSISLPLASSVMAPERDEAEGCIQCQRGSKLVLFVTGKCHWKCDYCPLSENRREIDIMFANERPCSELSEVIEEAKAMAATGTGITGGDPMMDLPRTLAACQALKQEFGPQHHIHMYTSLPFDSAHAQSLSTAGLDEIRFHLLDLKLSRYLPTMQACASAGISVGVELPVEPDQSEQLWQLLEELRTAPITFLNLNELEITTGNQQNMELRGFNLSTEITAGAAGSAELALEMKQRISAAANNEPDPKDGELRQPYGYHLKFCTSSYKDAGQLRARFRRRGEATLRPYEVMSEDDTLMFGAMYCPQEHGQDDMQELVEVLNIDSSWLRWDESCARIEMPIIIAEELAEKLATPFAVVEVHPTHERLEVSLTWLNQYRP